MGLQTIVSCTVKQFLTGHLHVDEAISDCPWHVARNLFINKWILSSCVIRQTKTATFVYKVSHV